MKSLYYFLGEIDKKKKTKNRTARMGNKIRCDRVRCTYALRTSFCVCVCVCVSETLNLASSPFLTLHIIIYAHATFVRCGNFHRVREWVSSQHSRPSKNGHLTVEFTQFSSSWFGCQTLAQISQRKYHENCTNFKSLCVVAASVHTAQAASSHSQ